MIFQNWPKYSIPEYLAVIRFLRQMTIAPEWNSIKREKRVKWFPDSDSKIYAYLKILSLFFFFKHLLLRVTVYDIYNCTFSNCV